MTALCWHNPVRLCKHLAGELAGPGQLVAGPGLMRSATQPQGLGLSSGYGALGSPGAPGRGGLTRCGRSTPSWPDMCAAANAACSIGTTSAWPDHNLHACMRGRQSTS